MTEKKKERISRIINILLSENAANVRELSGTLKVSEMTVRRDLNFLAKENIVRLMHGAAVLNPLNRPDADSDKYAIDKQEIINREKKMRIGEKAASLINPDDIIIIDTGSTTDCLAQSVPYDLKISVLCFALNILTAVNQRKNCTITFAGGELHRDTLMFESQEGINLIKRFRATKAFISASGVNSKLGVTCSTRYETETKQACINSALKNILLVDSSKFDKIKPGYFADIKDFDVIITDDGIPDSYKKYILDLGIKLITV